jgi:hypothetical protein
MYHMISVTGEYLVNIIERHIGATINKKRGVGDESIDVKNNPPSNEEVADFLLSIPYFDQGVKNFILGNGSETTMIVSQAWEIAFILRTKKWSESETWLQNRLTISHRFCKEDSEQVTDFLKLPY